MSGNAIRSILRQVDQVDFETVQWLLPAAITVHNMEEAIWLPGWSQKAGDWHPPVSPSQFRFALIVVTGLAYLVTYTTVTGGRESVGGYLLTGLAFVMLLNVLFPHLGATVLLRRYTPGVVTAVLLNLPLTLYLLRRAFRERYISPKRFAIAAILGPPSTVVLIAALFKVGKWYGDASSHDVIQQR